MKIRIGSRDSRLAVIQAELVMAQLRELDSSLELELVTMKTTGDRILDRTLDKIGGKGLFVKELDAALLDGRVDLTVHSCKDLPMEENPLLPLGAFPKREDPRDVLVLPEGVQTLDASKPIGCASQRRTVQLAQLYPHIRVEPVRGNVQTRLRKLDEGQYSALILAAAGLRRLGLENRISRIFTTEEMIPAAGQGILAVQTRVGFPKDLLACLDNRDSRDCATAERAFVRRLNGGCSAPMAAYASVSDGQITLTGLYVDSEGNMKKGTVAGQRQDCEVMAISLAEGLV